MTGGDGFEGGGFSIGDVRAMFDPTEGQVIAVVGMLIFWYAMRPIRVLTTQPIRTLEFAVSVTRMRRVTIIGLTIIGFIIETLMASAMTIFWFLDSERTISNWKFLFTLGTFVVMIEVATITAQGFVNRIDMAFVFGFSLVDLVLAIVVAALYTVVVKDSGRRRENSSDTDRGIYGLVIAWVNVVFKIAIVWILYKVSKIEAGTRKPPCAKQLLTPPCDVDLQAFAQGASQDVTVMTQVESAALAEASIRGAPTYFNGGNRRSDWTAGFAVPAQ
jgi:hypothetical protein